MICLFFLKGAIGCPTLARASFEIVFRTTLGKWFSASPTRRQSWGPSNKASWSVFEASSRWDRSRTLQPRKSKKSIKHSCFLLLSEQFLVAHPFWDNYGAAAPIAFLCGDFYTHVARPIRCSAGYLQSGP